MRFRIVGGGWPVSWPMQSQVLPAGTIVDTMEAQWSWVTAAPPNAVPLNSLTADWMRHEPQPRHLYEDGW